MDIIDYSKSFDKSTNFSKHAACFPKNIFCVIAGATGCGKTNLMLNLLLNAGVLDYTNVFIHSSTLYQPSYDLLRGYYSNLENRIKKCCKKEVKIAHFIDSDGEIKNPSELDPKGKHIMIFDDMMNEDQTKIKDYFCKGRHNNVNVFYLCQSLHKIAKHCVRQNANIFILFHQDDKTLKYFHETHISGDMDFKDFKEFCDKAWSKKHGFVVINLWDEPNCGRYIANYNMIYTPNKYIKMH